jgi:hypothetical protein
MEAPRSAELDPINKSAIFLPGIASRDRHFMSASCQLFGQQRHLQLRTSGNPCFLRIERPVSMAREKEKPHFSNA